MLKIRRISNGWILEYPSAQEEHVICEEGFTHDDERTSAELLECKAFQQLLRSVAEIERPYSKHRTYNVVIDIEKEGTVLDGEEVRLLLQEK